MKLQDIDILKIMPAFMREESSVIALCEALNPIIRKSVEKLDFLSVWSIVDELNSEMLDELAWELNIGWYDKNVSLDVKRQLVKQSDMVHATLGTAWAVREVAKTYLGTAETLEWFEYDGTAQCFKIITENLEVSPEYVTRLIELLSIVKRASAWLEAIIFRLRLDFDQGAGSIIRDFNRNNIDFEEDTETDTKAKMLLTSGVIMHQSIISIFSIENVEVIDDEEFYG